MEGQVPEVDAWITELYGTSPLLECGVVHPSSAVRAADGQLHVIKVGELSPKSARDFFVLSLCRARADVVLTTASNLRAEPALSHALVGPLGEALTRYRREVLHKERPLCCAIMTREGDLPLDHEVFRDGTEKLVLTSPESAARVRAALGRHARVLGLAALDARVACAFLTQLGHALISVEAGPSTSAALYTDKSLVDELLLSTYEEPLAAELVGGALPEEALFRERTCVCERRLVEASGRWCFQRWLRR